VRGGHGFQRPGRRNWVWRIVACPR
jgi:hypothetical protein